MGVVHHHDRDDHNRPFAMGDTSLYTTDVANNNTTKSLGMASELHGFTSDQWKELERQAMIYKYIKQSIPVPPYLLLPSTGDHGSIFNLNFKLATNGKDSEPERCKRTDGKKWRCSRDVAPHQKYCERHLHRGRPRSRKPVEIHSSDNYNFSNKKSRFDQNILPSSTKVTQVETPPNLFHPDVTISSQSEFTRYPDWAMKEQWHHSLGQNVGFVTGQGNIPYTNPSFFEQDFFQDPQNLIPFSNFGNDPVKIFDNQQTDIENGLTDTWSSEDPHSNESSVFSQGNFSTSSLSLSMGIDAENDVMELHIGDTYDNPQVSRPGGPLAEVLWGSTIAEIELS